MRAFILIVLTGLMAGCVNQLAVRQARLAPLVGQPEIALIQAMGVPDRTYETGGVKFLAYTERRTEVLPSAPYGPPPWGWDWGWYGPAFPPQVVNLVCETTFALSGGIVRSFSLRGNACG
jgi:hypothetical protein